MTEPSTPRRETAAEGHGEGSAPDPGEGLRRVLGPFDATCVVVGAIVGVGIFFTPTRVATLAGSGGLTLLAWAMGGTIALLGALTFAELGGLVTGSGSQYRILRESYGPFVAFLYVFCNATAIQAGAIAIIALVCAMNLGVMVTGHVPGTATLTLLATILIVLLVLANIAGVKWGSAIQNLTVLAKILALLAVTAMAALLGKEPVLGSSALESTSVSAGSLLFAALVPTLFSFGGWQHALWIGGEVKNPERNVPRAIVVGVLVVVTVYLLANWAYLRLLGHQGVASSHAVAADAVGAVWPSLGAKVVAGAVAISAFGVLNAQLLSGPRLLYTMARDGRFFRAFGKVHARFSTPWAAVALLGGLALLLLYLTGQEGVDRLLTGVVFIDGIFFVLTGICIFLLRKKMPDSPRPVRVPLYPVVPALFVLGELAVLGGALADPATRDAAGLGAAWIGGATLLYLALFQRRSVPRI
jgi:APA family basic amino acid/polyamine antiporter